MNSGICVKKLSHQFGEKVVLDNISFQVERGEIFGLLGPSGAGKTTLINILTGQLRASGSGRGNGENDCSDGSAGGSEGRDCPGESVGGSERNGKSGESYILGKASHSMTGEDYKKIGIMMDNMGLYERMSCYDNLRFYQMLDGFGGKRVRKISDSVESEDAGKVLNKMNNKKIESVLAEVGLLDAQKTLVMNLSKGMKNRLAFARAIMKSPQILFLDEPTSGLDPATLESIHEMILKERERGTTIFLTTHNMHEAEKLCDKIALLNEGKIVEYGAPGEICRRYNHQKKIRVHLNSGEDVELSHEASSGKLLQEYFERDEVETIHSTEPNLETIFIELTGRKLEA